MPKTFTPSRPGAPTSRFEHHNIRYLSSAIAAGMGLAILGLLAFFNPLMNALTAYPENPQLVVIAIAVGFLLAVGVMGFMMVRALGGDAAAPHSRKTGR